MPYQHPSSRVAISSPCYDLHIIEGISVVNFEASSCTKFQIFRGSARTPLTALPQPPDGVEGAPSPSPRTPPTLLALSRSFVPLPVAYTPT